MHLEQILRNLDNDLGTLYQKTGLKYSQEYLDRLGICRRPVLETQPTVENNVNDCM